MTDRERYEDALRLLWKFLQGRLDARIKGQLPIGQHSASTVVLRDRNGMPGNYAWVADLKVGHRGGELLCGVYGKVERALADEDKAMAPFLLDAVAEFARLGIIRQHASSNEVEYLITWPGADALRQADYREAPAGEEYLHAFRDEFSGVEDFAVVDRYLDQAAKAYRANLDLAATVMMGVCYEFALLQIATAVCGFGDRGGDLSCLVAKELDDLNKYKVGDYVAAGRLERIVHKALVAHARGLGSELQQWVTHTFSPGFMFMRALRNDAGHPTDSALNRMEIASMLTLFPSTFRRARAVVEKLGSLP